jgi:hypothetical protein
MAVSIVSTPDLSGYTFYRSKDFDISFSIVNTAGVDTSLYFSNSTYGVLPYVSNGHFKSTSGVNALGSIGTLSVDVLSSNPRFITTATPQSYVAAVGICTDPSGNVYFAVANQNRVFQLDLSGTVSPFAGTGVYGDSDGDRITTAQFRAPAGVITDGSGTFYVTDQHRVRKIDPSGTVSTLAGSSSSGSVDATGTNARFFLPGTMALRPNGDLLVTESDMHVIRNVTLPGAVVTTYAGKQGVATFADGSLNAAPIPVGQFLRGATTGTTLYDTSDVSGAWTSNSSLVALNVRAMVNTLNASCNKIFYGGDYNSSYGTSLVYQASVLSPIVATTGIGTALTTVRAIGYDSGTGYFIAGGQVASGSNQRLYRSTNGGATWSTAGVSSTLCNCEAIVRGGTFRWMAGGDGSNGGAANLLMSGNANGNTWTATDVSIGQIRTIAYGGTNWAVGGSILATGQVHLATSSNDGISWVKRDISVGGAGRTVSKLAYGAGLWVASFDIGDSGSFGPGIVYSSDLSSWSGATGDFPSGYYTPKGLTYSTTQRCFIASIDSNLMTSTTGMTWVATSNVLPASGITAFIDVSQGSEPVYGTARMYFPYGISYDSSGTLYIADQYNNRVRAIVAGTNAMTTFAGSGSGSISNGTLTTAGMARPSSLALDPSSGTIYVGSFERNTLQTIIGSNVSLLAGAEYSAGYADGLPATARFNGLAGLARFGSNLYMTEVYNGDVRNLVTFPDVRPGAIRPSGYTIISTSNYPITLSSRIDVSWTSVGGSLPLYKFEPFSNTFTARVGGDTLVYPTSSTELLGYLTGTGTANAAFSGPNGASTAYTYPLTLTVRALSGTTVVDDVSTSVTINPARIIYTPCNSSLVFYRNEPSPAPVFSLVAANASNVYAATTLPTGLSFTRTDSKSFALTGTPTVQTISSNYTILATDTSGRTYATQVSMIVNPERLLIDVSGSLALSNVGLTAPIDPITFTSRFAPYGGYRAMQYTWTPPPPAGIQFRDICGTAILGSSYSVNTTYDSSFTLTLSGTITEAQLRAFATSNLSNYTVTLTGTRITPLPALSPSLPKTITFRFGETIFFDSNIPSRGLYVGLAVSNYWYSATTYFPQLLDTSIESIAVTDGFIPDGLDASFTRLTQRFTFAGTPTNAASYGFTLTASNGMGVSASLPVTAVISNDSVTITPLSGSSFNFIQTRSLSNAKVGFYPSPISYSVTSDSGCNVTLTGANLPPGVSIVSNGTTYDLSGRPTTASGLTTATLTGVVAATGATSNRTFAYSVSAETFFFPRDPSDISFNFIQNVPIEPVQIDVSTLSENSVIRFSAPSIPSALQVTNTGLVQGTPRGSNSGTFDVTVFTAFASGTQTYSYAMTPDQVLLQPTVYTTVTAPGQFVSIPILGYSLSALTVSNYRFESAFPYGLSINPTTGLLSGTLASSLPTSTTFNLLGSAGIVDGSLGGTMATDNLTVNRAQLIEIQSQSNLRVYYSDDGGSNWGLAASSNGLVAARVGANNVDTYLIPTSSDVVLRSTTGSNYTSSALGQSAAAPLMTGITYNSASSTWWIGGTLSNGTRSVRVFKTLNDGLTWDAGTTVSSIQDRSSNATPGAGVYNPYLYGGVDIAFRDGVLLLGGTQMARSTDDGATWSAVSSSLTEVGRFSLDQGLVWVAVGSSLYSSLSNNTYTADATTIVFSLDQGVSWAPAASGFNMNAYEILYANGVWLASGLDWTGSAFVGRIRYSFDGVNWPILTAIPSVTYATTLDVRPPGALGTIGYDQGNWKLLRTPNDGTATLYSHSDSTPIDVGWTTTVVTTEFSGIGAQSRFSSYTVQTINPGADITTITFPYPNTGPTFVSPAQSTYVVWQYMPLPPIVFSAPGATGYFVSALPVGLTWNSATFEITGSCMQLGTQNFTVYAKSSLGLTAFTVTLIVDVPRIVKPQSGAGAYTAMVRDYTKVAAAINARDTRVNPVEEAALGSFASPYAPDVITPSNCPC